MVNQSQVVVNGSITRVRINRLLVGPYGFVVITNRLLPGPLIKQVDRFLPLRLYLGYDHVNGLWPGARESDMDDLVLEIGAASPGSGRVFRGREGRGGGRRHRYCVQRAQTLPGLGHPGIIFKLRHKSVKGAPGTFRQLEVFIIKHPERPEGFRVVRCKVNRLA